MKKIKPLLFLFFLLLNTSVSLAGGNDTEKLFKSGSDFLTHGNYAKAINTFESLKNKGVSNAALYCNLGNAYYNAGQPGKAIFCLEKGLLLAPLDTELMHNKNMVNAQLALPRFNEDASLLPKTSSLLRVTDDGLIVAVILLVIGSLLFAAVSFKVLPNLKSTLKTNFKYCLIIAILLFAGLSGLLIWRQSPNYAIAITKTAEVKTGPGSMAKNVFILNEGEKVEIENAYDGWYKIKRYNDAEGWVNGAEIGVMK
jgi:tetratricopeptide (TPR) repeat protein